MKRSAYAFYNRTLLKYNNKMKSVRYISTNNEG